MMKTSNRILVGLVLIIVLLFNPAFAQDQNKKAAIGARVSYMNLSDGKIEGINVDYDDTALSELNISYFPSDRFSFEISAGRMKIDLDIEVDGGLYNIGEIKQTPVMLTARMHSPPVSSIISYFGIGVGYYFNSFENSGLVNTLNALLAQYNMAGLNLMDS